MYQYPYGNAQQLNLDWLMEQWQTVKQSIDGSLQGEIDRVEAAMTDLLNARDAAVAAAGAANTSAGAAAASAQAAAADAATATAQAAAANTARSNAAQAANNAQQYAGNAQTQAAAAQNAAGQAAASANQAAADASGAHDDAVAASGSAVNAAASAAGALQNFQLSDAARQAAQAAEQDAEAAATLLQPPATSADIGKALIVKTVGGGTVTGYELGESGGGTPAIVNSIEDVSVASFDDGTVNPVQQIVVDIEPVQAGSGDPAPDNVRPITGWTGANVKRTGKNMVDIPSWFTALGISYTVDNDGWITADALGPSYFNPYSFGKTITGSLLFLIKPETTTTNLRVSVMQGSQAVAETPANNPSSSKIENRSFDRFKLNWSVIGTATFKLMIVPETTIDDTDVSPFNGSTYPITFPSEAGTVYGGTLTNLGTDEWKLRVEKVKIVEDGTSNWSSGNTTNNWRWSRPLTVPTITPTTQAQAAESISDKFVSLLNVYSDGVNSVGFFARDTTMWVRFGSDSTLTTNEAVKAWFTNNPTEFVYPLATPVEYTITTADVITLLSGYNNIWSDTGNINLLQYYADSKKYIDEQDALVKALIAPVLDDMIADTALTANDFRIVDNILYRITAPVATGAALTPNTNCTATTIGAILKTLLT